MSSLEERLEKAFADAFAAKESLFGGGCPGSYGVCLENVTADCSETDLVVTFRSGVRYCCFESICHFDYRVERQWAGLRECMDRHGLEHLALPAVRRFRGVVEPGAVATPSPKMPEVVVVEGASYELEWPWRPPIVQDANQTLPGETALLSEQALAVDWSRPDEDVAWSHLLTKNSE